MAPGPTAEVCNWNCVGAAAPVPLTIFVAGELPGVLLATRTVALRPPAASGVNVTVTEHDPPIGIVAVQLFVCEKSFGFDPPIVTPVTCSGAVAVARFVTVNV